MADHAARIGAVIRLREAEAANPFTCRQSWQELPFLRLRPEFVDGQHDQRALNAHHRTEARIHTLDFAGDEAVADIVETGAAVGLGNGDAQHVEPAELAEDRRIRLFPTESVADARGETILALVACRIAGEALLVRQLLVEEEGIVPAEASLGCRGHA